MCIPAVVLIMGIISIIFHKQIGRFLYKLKKDTKFMYDDMKTLYKILHPFKIRTVKGLSKIIFWMGIGLIILSIILYFWVSVNAL